jgi:SnoaL-like domain
MSASQHLISNVVVRLDGDRAESSCYLQAQHVRTGTAGGDNFIIAGRYDDQLVRGPDGWRIRERRLAVLWTDGNPAVAGRLPGPSNTPGEGAVGEVFARSDRLTEISEASTFAIWRCPAHAPTAP